MSASVIIANAETNENLHLTERGAEQISIINAAIEKCLRHLAGKRPISRVFCCGLQALSSAEKFLEVAHLQLPISPRHPANYPSDAKLAELLAIELVIEEGLSIVFADQSLIQDIVSALKKEFGDSQPSPTKQPRNGEGYLMLRNATIYLTQ